MIIGDKKNTDKNFTMTLKPVLCQASKSRMEYLFLDGDSVRSWYEEVAGKWIRLEKGTIVRYERVKGENKRANRRVASATPARDLPIFGHANCFSGHCQQRFLTEYFDNPGTDVGWGSIKSLDQMRITDRVAVGAALRFHYAKKRRSLRRSSCELLLRRTDSCLCPDY